VNRSGAAPADRALLRRATRAIAVQTGVAVAIVVVAVAGIAFLVDARAQTARVQETVRTAARTADDVTDPPAGVVLLARSADGRLQRSPGAPARLTGLDPSKFGLGRSTFTVGSDSYQAFTSVRANGTRFVAVLNTGELGEERDRLGRALLLAGVIGIVGAAVIGGLIGRRATRPLGDALALQRRFVADASHELRTPLTVLHTRAQILSRHVGANNDPALTDQVRELVADTRALGEVVEDLLLSAELQHRPDRQERVDLAAVGADVVRAFAPYAEELGVELRFEASPPDEGVVAGVRSSLHRAVGALVDNALAHNRTGGHVTVGVRRRGDEVVLTVADDGEGLDPEIADTLLRRFGRGEQASGHGRRFGLGLALVREVVQAHRGRLDLDGRPGVGATVTVVLPALERVDPRPPLQ
jgi:signal transduction histidine kinase